MGVGNPATTSGVGGSLGGGSGGSIYVSCATSDGTNVISACGVFNNVTSRGMGGGGRIAIRIFGRDSFTGAISATNGCSGYAYATVAQPGTVYYKVSGGLKIIVR